MLSQEIINEVFDLNLTFNGKAEELFGFSYETNGYYECIKFNDHVLWDDDCCQAWLSERPDFDEDDYDEDDYDEDIIGCVKRRFNDYVNTLKGCRYDVKSKKTENSSVEEAVNGIIDDLSDRGGLSDEWFNIGEEIQEEIIAKWINIIEKNI